ncbi:hypothetical protein EGI22_10960 [Lacihabitans sp. LS3-19]|uniref:hypothetical protein n=1 Tax=Lacihabitans sp. LS3-19 TaxID=2487335 RepID=UPI0020CBA142|nr:hypothetical protein [Lacihabitans sp. LS3-19]MCP9768434.1 hypothetical protein [Lacihabitans sp. LS3-19]
MKKYLIVIALSTIGFLKVYSQSIELVPANDLNTPGLQVKTDNRNYGFMSTKNSFGIFDFYIDRGLTGLGTRISSIDFGPDYAAMSSFSDNFFFNTAKSFTFDKLTNSSISPILHLDTDLGVGIGTYDPKKRLHVMGANNGNSGVTPHPNGHVFFENNNAFYLGFGVPNNKESGILFGRPDKGSTSGGIIYTQNKMLQFRTLNNANRMVIDSLGNIGIGTTIPLNKLHVEGDAFFNSNLFKVNASTIDLDGTVFANRLMIGNLVANTQLHVRATNPTIRLTEETGGDGPTDGFEINMDATNANFNNFDNGNISFQINNGEKMKILPNGNVGIADGLPTVKLAVGGDFALSSKTSSHSTGQLNNFARNNKSVIRFSSAGAVTLTGIEAGPDGTILYIYTTASVSSLTIKNENASSASANQIITGFPPGLPTADEQIFGEGAVTLIYDSTSEKWRILSIKQ